MIAANKPLSLRLRDLAAHLEGLDSASPEAVMLRDAAGLLDSRSTMPNRISQAVWDVLGAWRPEMSDEVRGTLASRIADRFSRLEGL